MEERKDYPPYLDYPKGETTATTADAELHFSVLERIHKTYVKKNHDYGNSFDQSLDEFGSVAGVVRIGDKFNRLKQLTKKDFSAQVEDEGLTDTLLDMANYCIMTAMWLDKQYCKKHSEDVGTDN